MGVLFDKNVSEMPDKKDDKDDKSFLVALKKYKSVVVVNSVKVDEDDDCLLQIDFSHDIDATNDEVADELGKVILEMLEESLKYPVDNAVVEKDKDNKGV